MPPTTLSNLAITDTLHLDDYLIRPSRATDIPSIVALLNAHSRSILGTSTILLEQYSTLWPKQYFNAPENTVVVTTPADEVVGYLELAAEHPGVVLEISGAVHPHYQGAGIGRTLLSWAERKAHVRCLRAPAGTQVSLQISLHASDLDGRDLAGRAGFAPARRWAHFEISLTHAPEPPTWPDGIRVRELNPYRDWPTVGSAMLDAYRDHWGHISAQFPEPPHAPEDELVEAATFFDDDPYFNTHGLCFVAIQGDEVVGSCIGAARTVEWQDSGQIGSISVRRPWRRQGVATALLQHAFRAYYRRGIYRVVAECDQDSFTGAHKLFSQVGMSRFRHADIYEKVIRRGRELRQLSYH